MPSFQTARSSLSTVPSRPKPPMSLSHTKPNASSFSPSRRLKPRRPIIPARVNNQKATHPEGRKLRRYRRRWIVERTFAWLGHFRRLVVRYERLITTYAGFFHMAWALLTLRRVLR